MKRIDALIPNIKRKEAIESILKAGAQGVTIVESRGKGAGDRPLVRGTRGITRFVAGYNRIDTITTAVDDSNLSTVISAIMNAPTLVLAVMVLFLFLVLMKCTR